MSATMTFDSHAVTWPVNPGTVRPLLGKLVTVTTPLALVQGTLLSCVKSSAWLVVNDYDMVIRLDEIVSIEPVQD